MLPPTDAVFDSEMFRRMTRLPLSAACSSVSGWPEPGVAGSQWGRNLCPRRHNGELEAWKNRNDTNTIYPLGSLSKVTCQTVSLQSSETEVGWWIYAVQLAPLQLQSCLDPGDTALCQEAEIQRKINWSALDLDVLDPDRWPFPTCKQC